MKSWKGGAAVIWETTHEALQWGHDNEVVEGTDSDRLTRVARSFNGATTMKSWKGNIACQHRTPYKMLQWGHDNEVVEGPDLLLELDRFIGASMGPRQ